MRRFFRGCITKIIAAIVIVFVIGVLLWTIAPFLFPQAINPSTAPSSTTVGSDQEAAPRSDINQQSTFDPNLFDPNLVEWVTVSHVIDGDTIVIDNGLRVRYIGIDTPELDENECFATEATQRNRELINSQQVGLQQVGLRKDVSESDRYGRLLRYVYLKDGTMVNAQLVQDGYAVVASFPPDVLYIDHFRQLENQARSTSKGLWRTCGS